MNIYEKIAAIMQDVQYLAKDDHVKFGQTSYKALSEEKVTSIMRAELIFQSTLPVWGATLEVGPHCGRHTFQSTLPVWGATLVAHPRKGENGFQSTLPVWGATR